jgi:myo-inositol 2-dehydrogenase/D-chiro-inositol 1-dehydrogenase
MALNLAFFGAGPLAEPYLDALRRRQDAQVTAVCDIDRRAAEQTAAGWGAKVYLSYEAMLEEAQPDALWVCVPPHLQGDVLLKAVKRRTPFFVAPPGAVDYQRARHYAREIAQARLVTAVGFAGRDADVVREAREYLGANVVPLALGWWLAPPSSEPGAPGPSSPPDAHASVIGQLWSDACSLVDGMRFFCGEVTRVRALTTKAGEPEASTPTDGGLVLQLEFARGTVGMLTCATFARPEPRIELELLGPGWSLRFGRDLGTLRLDEHDKTTILRCLNAPAVQQTAAFLEAVASSNPAAVSVPYAEALQTLAVCHAAGLSARENRPVEIAEVIAEPGAPVPTP